MSEHTPGPWLADVDGSGWSINTEDKGVAFTCGEANDEDISKDEEAANARLIAAAPDLLAALKLALAALDCEVDNAPISPVVASAAQAWMKAKFGDAARKAITKAEGA
jgi:hypothetical protein